MHNPFFKRFREFILAPSHSRTISAVVILIIAAAVPLTVLVAQKQQELRQHAVSTGSSCATVGAKSCNGNIPMVCLLTSPPYGKYWEPAGAACTYGCLSTGTCAPAPTITCKAGTGGTAASCGGHASYSCSSSTNCEEYTYRCSGSSCISGAHAPVALSLCAKGSICNPAPYCSAFNVRDCIYGCNPTTSGGTCKSAPASTCTGSGETCMYTQCSTGYSPVTNGHNCNNMYMQCCKATAPAPTSPPNTCAPKGGQCYKYNCPSSSYRLTADSCGAMADSACCFPPTTTSPCSKTISGKYVIGGVCSGSSLYTCNGAGGSTGSKVCTYGCQVNTGTYDTCKSAPAPAPSGPCATKIGGLYVKGGFCSGSTLYQCSGTGVSNSSQVCANGCQVNPGTYDTCKSAPPPTATCITGTGKTNSSCGGTANDTYKCTGTGNNCELYTYACRGVPLACANGAHAPGQPQSKCCPTAGQVCSNGACTASCAAPNITCNGACVDKLTNTNNCGGCAIVCASGQTCTNGTCTTSCAAPNVDCNGTCVNTQTSNSNCGDCTTACTSGQTCTNGTCASPTPTPSPAPGDTSLAFTIGIDAIGSTGDNVNPDSSSSTQNPLTPTRNLTVQVLDSNNNLTANQVGSINYNAGTGLFTGTINLGQGFVAGNYTVKVSSDGHLRRLIPGIQNITLGQTVQMPRVNLVAGDVDSNNTLNINDYNILLSCISDPDLENIDNHALCNTNSSYAKLSNLDDNGTINKFDYNLFLREYAVQNGD